MNAGIGAVQGVDIFKGIRQAQALGDDETLFRAIFQATKAAIVLTNTEGKVVESNRAMQEMLGYSREELYQTTWAKLTYPDDIPLEKAILERLHDGTGGKCHFEKRCFRKDGSIRWGRVAASLLRGREGEPQFIVYTVEDITEHKNAEKERLAYYQEQIRSLASELSLAEQRERRHIAACLHDRVAQNLSFSKIKLEMMRESASSSGLAECLDQISGLVEQAIQDIRCVIVELSPPVLYELGLEAALEWLVDQMQKHHNIVTELEDDGQPKPLDNDVRGVLFRAVRELLVNVAKHSHSDRAKVSIRRKSNNICIRVEDQGIGFDVSEIKYRKGGTGGFGLFNINERLSYVSGECMIESGPDIGTRITLIAPLKTEEE